MSARLHKDKRRLCRKVGRLLCNVTPLRADCGTLCDRRCCKGDSDTGMLLFPGERTPFAVKEANGRRLAVCSGTCRRTQRPLSCRMFPFLPVKTPQGKVRVVTDRRSAGLCPLVRHAEDVVFSQRFLHRLQKAGKLLFADADCRAFLADAKAQSDAQQALMEKFLKK